MPSARPAAASSATGPTAGAAATGAASRPAARLVVRYATPVAIVAVLVMAVAQFGFESQPAAPARPDHAGTHLGRDRPRPATSSRRAPAS